MTIVPLERSEMPALAEFFGEVGAAVAPETLEQFSTPRAGGAGPVVGTLVLKEGGRILGAIGYIDIPMKLSGPTDDIPVVTREETMRWPINHFLLPECRGRGLGKQLMQASWEGASCLLAIGGTESSIPARDKSGWRPLGQLSCFRFKAPIRTLVAGPRLKDRRNTASRSVPPEMVTLASSRHRVVARRCRRMTGWLPWVDPAPPQRRIELGATRSAAYLEFAFFGPLSKYHVVYTVSVDGMTAGYFVLAARADRLPWLSIEIVDLDAAPGYEREVIEAARATGFTRGDIVRLRVGGDRFTTILRALKGDVRESPDHAFRVSSRPGSLVELPQVSRISSWRLTYGDHDQYRVRIRSQTWSES